MNIIEGNYLNFKEKITVYLVLTALVLTSLAITHGDTSLAPQSVSSILILGNWALFLMIVFLVNWKQPISMVKFLTLLLGISWFMLYHFHVSVNSGGSGLLQFLYILLLAFLSKNVLQCSVNLFRKYLIVVSTLGIIAYVDFLTFSIFPHSLVDYYTKSDFAFYINYYFAYILEARGTLRLCGLFNEPGYLGTFLAFALLIDKLNLRKKGNIVMFIAGCLTLSMAFFALIIIGGVLFVVKNPKYILALASTSFLLFMVLPQIENKGVQNLLERFEYDSKAGSFKGDNRVSKSLDILYKDFQQSDHKLLGMGTGYCSSRSTGFATYKKYLIEWGYLGFSLTFGFLIVIAVLACGGVNRALSLQFALLSLFTRDLMPLISHIWYYFSEEYTNLIQTIKLYAQWKQTSLSSSNISFNNSWYLNYNTVICQ